MTALKKTCQTAVKYTPELRDRIERAIVTKNVPRASIFHCLMEMALEYSEKNGARLEDSPALIRNALLSQPPSPAKPPTNSQSASGANPTTQQSLLRQGATATPSSHYAPTGRAAAVSSSGVDSAKT